MGARSVTSVSSGMRQRRWWVALAILALAFLSLRPACDVWLSHWSKHGGTHAVTAHSMQAP